MTSGYAVDVLCEAVFFVTLCRDERSKRLGKAEAARRIHRQNEG
jgi:hypothetical protein